MLPEAYPTNNLKKLKQNFRTQFLGFIKTSKNHHENGVPELLVELGRRKWMK